MYATSRQFIAKAQEEGNPAVIDLICYLHPTHIAFKKAVQVLNNDVLAYLVNLHSFFKHSTAHREESGSGEMFRGNGGQFCRGTGSVTSILTQVQRYCRLSEAKRAEAEQKQTHVCADLG